jgi:hypothetical protein
LLVLLLPFLLLGLRVLLVLLLVLLLLLLLSPKIKSKNCCSYRYEKRIHQLL